MTAQEICSSCGKVCNDYYRPCCPNERVRRSRNARNRNTGDAYEARDFIKSPPTSSSTPKRKYNKRKDVPPPPKEPTPQPEPIKQHPSQSTAWKSVKVKTEHKCCECGKKIPNRRCDKCLAKWRIKHGVSSGICDD